MTFKGRLALGGRGVAGQPAYFILCKCHCPRSAQSPGGRERKPISAQGFQELCGRPQPGTQG